MKQLIFLFSAAIFMNGCDHSHQQAEQPVVPQMSFYGAQFDPAGAISVEDLQKKMQGQDSLRAVLTCTIQQTCRKAGCWMDVQVPGGEPMTVFMKDHAFGVPLEGADGLKAYVSGVAYYDTLSVEYLRHIAEDAEKPQAEIDAITEPKLVLAMDADGVIIEGYKGEAPAEGHDHEHDHDHEHGEEGHSH